MRPLALAGHLVTHALQRVTLSVTESGTQWTLRLSTGSVKAHVLLISEGRAVSDALRVVISWGAAIL